MSDERKQTTLLPLKMVHTEFVTDKDAEAKLKEIMKKLKKSE